MKKLYPEKSLFVGWTRDLKLIPNPEGWLEAEDERGKYWYRNSEVTDAIKEIKNKIKHD